jgi:ribosomal protein L13
VTATEKEIQDMEEDEADEIALSQAVETMLATTRAGRKRKATSKVVENAKQAKTGGRSGQKV